MNESYTFNLTESYPGGERIERQCVAFPIRSEETLNFALRCFRAGVTGAIRDPQPGEWLFFIISPPSPLPFFIMATSGVSKPFQAKHIKDEWILSLVAGPKKNPNLGQSLEFIQDSLPGFPPKVVLAKLRQMINKGRLEGCGCGCRGDFNLPKEKK